jgi:hypothetical protein
MVDNFPGRIEGFLGSLTDPLLVRDWKYQTPLQLLYYENFQRKEVEICSEINYMQMSEIV